jgi:hypothetical protein
MAKDDFPDAEGPQRYRGEGEEEDIQEKTIRLRASLLIPPPSLIKTLFTIEKIQELPTNRTS